MKKWLFLAFLIAFFCAGCATLEETYYLDREFGKAQMESWNKMIAYPDDRYSDQKPDGMAGIHGEAAMDVYHRSFDREPTRNDVLQLGIITQ